MTPEALKATRFFTWEPDSYTKANYPKGKTFNRLTLTLSAKGWTSSVQWEGTVGARGIGKTIEEAIDASIKFASTEWNGYDTTDPKAKY